MNKIKMCCKPLMAVLLGALILLSMCNNFNVSAAEKSVYLSDMDWVSYTVSEGFTPGVDETIQFGNIITIAGVEYEKGLSVHPAANGISEILYDINGLNYKTFSATAGKDLEAATAVGEDALAETLIQFYVLVDNVVKADSGALKYGETYKFNVDVTGGSKLILRVTEGGDAIYCDHGSWGNPILSSGSTDEVIVTLLPTEKLSSPSFTKAPVTENQKTSTPKIATPKATDKIESKSTNSTGTIITIVVAGLIVSAVVIGLLVMTKAKKNKG